MTASRFLIFIFCLLALQLASLAQTNITGKIIDSKPQTPIPHVEVFISGTTSGCITDSLGNFNQKAPFFPCTMVADHVSYELNRRTTYYGSYRHFLKSIYDNNPEQQGFEIEVFPKTEKAAFYEIQRSSIKAQSKEYVILADTLKVTYHFDDKKFPVPKEEIEGKFYINVRKSFIYPCTEPFVIRENGTSPKLSFIIDGLMVMKSFANSLPEDYLPTGR